MATEGDIQKTGGFTEGLQNLSTLFSLFSDKKSSSTTDQNVTEIVSPEKATALLQQMLNSTAGLAQVSSGQKTAGIYNSTTNEMLTNDLLASIAGEVASRSSVKVSAANTNNVMNAQGSVGKTAGALAALQAGSSLYKGITGNSIGSLFSSSAPAAGAGSGAAAGSTGILDSLGSSISSLFGGSSGAASAGTAAGGASAAGAGATAGGTAAGAGIGAGLSTIGGFGAAAMAINSYLDKTYKPTVFNPKETANWGRATKEVQDKWWDEYLAALARGEGGLTSS